MRLDPLEPRFPTALAQIYLFQRATQIDKAEPLFTRALEIDPNYFPALYGLGVLRFCCQNRIADGIRLAEQALRLDPTSTAVRGVLVHMYLDVGDLPAAEQLLANDQNQKRVGARCTRAPARVAEGGCHHVQRCGASQPPDPAGRALRTFRDTDERQ